MSTVSLHRNLRKQMPSLTPPFAGDSADMLDRFQMPQQSREGNLTRRMRDSIKPIAPPAPYPPEFEEPYDPGRRLTPRNLIEDARGLAGTGVLDLPNDARRRLGSYLPLGGKDITQHVPIAWPLEPDSARLLRRQRYDETNAQVDREVQQYIQRKEGVKGKPMGGVASGRANYRSADDDGPALVMPKRVGGGYAERVIDPTTGAVVGSGNREDDLTRQMRDSINPPADAPQLKPQQQPAPQMSSLPPMVDPENPETQANRSAASESIASQPMPRIHLGTSTKGLQGVKRDLARVQAARGYDSQGLNFKVRPDSVDMQPPDPHTDWKDRLKSGAKTAIISMANIKRSNPDASATELLAGGATGGAIGAISRDTGDAMFRRAQIEDMEGQLGPQIAREGALAKIETERQKPILEAEKVRRDEEYRRDQQQIQRDAEAGRITRADADLKLKELELVRKTAKDKSDDDYRRSRPSAEKGDTDFDNANIQASIDEASKERERIGAVLTNTPREVDGPYQGQKIPNPDYVDMMKRYRELDDQVRTWRQKLKAPAAAQSIRSSQPDTRKGTISKEQQQLWLRDNSGKTLDDMKKRYPNATMQ